MLVFVLLLIGLGMLALQHICLGSLIFGFSTPQLTIVSGWLTATAKWNLQYSDRMYIASHFLVQVAFVILWVFILNSLVSLISNQTVVLPQ